MAVLCFRRAGAWLATGSFVTLGLASCGDGAEEDETGVLRGTGGANDGPGPGSGGGNGSKTEGAGGGDSRGAGGATAGSGAAGDSGGEHSGTGCAGKDYLICEDFENAELGGTPTGWTKHGDASKVSDEVAVSGSKSLKLEPIAVWERRIYHDASMLGSSHWGRIYYRVAQPVPDVFVHSTLVAFSGVGPTIGEAEYRVVDTVKREVDFVVEDQQNKHQFLYNVQISEGPEFGEGTTYIYSFEDKWRCAEWHVDASVQKYELYVDDAEVIQFERGAGNYTDSEIPDSFDELKVGWINYQNSPPGFTAWIDDVAVDDERIGCTDAPL